MDTITKIERFLKRKHVIKILGENYILTPQQYKRLYALFDTFESIRVHEDRFECIATMIKYDVTNYIGRDRRLRKIKAFKGLYSCVLRYGKVEGKRRHDGYSKHAKRTLKSCREYWVNLGYTDELEINKMIAKHQKFANEHAIKVLKGQKNTCRSLEFWLNKGLTLPEAKKELARVQGRSLSYFISKYGVEVGTQKYNERIERFNNTWNSKDASELDLINRKKNIYNPESYVLRGFTESEAKKLANNAMVKSLKVNSKISQKFFEDLTTMLTMNGIDGEIFYYDKNREYAICGKRVDFYHKKSKIAIEFYGDYWHGNPEKYSPNDIIRTKMVKDKWAEDSKRISILKESKQITDILIVWEGNVRKNYDDELQRCFDAIKNRS